jgi:TonB family protein
MRGLLGAIAVVAALGLMLVAPSASAQQFPAAEGPVIGAPRLKSDSGAVYPEQALRDRVSGTVAVDLVLDIDARGRVIREAIAEPRGHGFDEAATSAAQRLVFEPATRDGSPVASRIKFKYVFEPPAPRLIGRVAHQVSDSPIAGARVTVRDASGIEHTTSTDSDGSWSVSGLSPGRVHIRVDARGKLSQSTDEDLAPGEEARVVLRLAAEPATSETGPGSGAVEEVTVKGERPPREVTKRTIGREEMEHSAGTYGDALLSLQNFPGVARPPPFSGQLVVRGSAPGDTNIYIDGTNIPLAYHFGGLSSVVPTELLEKIEFSPGNYSAEYGRGMGGVVDVGLRDPKTDGYHALAEGSILGLRALVEGPLGDGWSFVASGQRSWIDLVLTPVLKATGASETALPRWYDYQAEIVKRFDSRSSFRLLFFGSDDAFDFVNHTPNSSDPTLGGDFGYHTSFWRLQARFETRPSDRLRARFTAAYGEDAATISLGPNLLDTTLHPVSGRGEISATVARGVVANAGVDLLYEPYDLTLQLPPLTRPGIPSGGPGQLPVRSSTSGHLFLPGAYTDVEVTPGPTTRIVPGLRVDYDSATQRWDIAPRINMRQGLTPAFPRTTLKAGLGVYDQPPSPFDTDPRFGQSGLRSNRSIQADVGVEQEFSRNIDLSVDGFYKWMDRLVVVGEENSGRGYAYGVEWLLRYKPDEHFFGWVSYTLSRSERRDVPGEPYSLFQFDQTHVLTLLGSYKLGGGWEVGARFRLTSGDLYTPTSPGAYDATAGSSLGVSAVPPYGSRLPLFNQLDLRVERARTYGHFKVTWFVDLQNAYFANNPLGVTYNYNYTKSANISGLPILPIAGGRVEFAP